MNFKTPAFVLELQYLAVELHIICWNFLSEKMEVVNFLGHDTSIVAFLDRPRMGKTDIPRIVYMSKEAELSCL